MVTQARREPLYPSSQPRRQALSATQAVSQYSPTSPVLSHAESTLHAIAYHAKTLFLFTRSDYKTIFFPVFIFATVSAPAGSLRTVAHQLVWTWLHLLQANVSNQCFSGGEDARDKPWRPLPSGRVTVRQALTLRWALFPACLYHSYTHGWGVVAASALLSLVEFVHDDLRLSAHPATKNICNIGGYTTFEAGATLILAPAGTLDPVARVALVCSALVIGTTIHAQEFADVDGDRSSGRRTLPIVAPTGSRVSMLVLLLAWSAALGVLWELGPLSGALFAALGALVGARYLARRTKTDDERSYVFYNLWLITAHILPINARTGILRL